MMTVVNNKLIVEASSDPVDELTSIIKIKQSEADKLINLKSGIDAISGSTVHWKSWFGLLFLHRRLGFRSSSLKIIKSIFQVSHFLLDLTQFYPVLAAG
jgi:hypothetical protein